MKSATQAGNNSLLPNEVRNGALANKPSGIDQAGSGFIQNIIRNSKSSWLHPAEKTMAYVTLAAVAIDLVLIAVNGSQVDWPAYAAIIALIASLLFLGLVYRLSERSERIAAASICAGLFIFFSLALSMFNYQLLPLWREPIDPFLNQIDQMFGYHWPSVIMWSSEHPVINGIIKFAYMSTIPQFAAIVVILGLSGKHKELHILITSVTITATFAICFWGIFPSLGAKSLYSLPADVEALARPVVDTLYGKQLLHMAEFGPGLISPKEIKGLIAFPSYHIVLAVTAVYAARTVRFVFPIYLVLNALIFPGIYMHGGHHMVDLPFGLLVAVVGIYLAKTSVAKKNHDYEAADYLGR